jgi:hypothetical protein
MIRQMRVRFVSLVVCLVVGTSLVACSRAGPSAPDGLFFPTVPRQDAYPAALLSARLVERSGCLVAGGKAGGLVLLWPDGYTARTGQDGRTQVLDENGTVVGTVGEKVTLGGGGDVGAFDTPTAEQTPDACGHKYFLVAPPS